MKVAFVKELKQQHKSVILNMEKERRKEEKEFQDKLKNYKLDIKNLSETQKIELSRALAENSETIRNLEANRSGLWQQDEEKVANLQRDINNMWEQKMEELKAKYE